MANEQARAKPSDEQRLTHLLDLTAQIISSHASSTSVASEDLPNLIGRVFGSLSALNLDETPSQTSAEAKSSPTTSEVDAPTSAPAAIKKSSPGGAKPTKSKTPLGRKPGSAAPRPVEAVVAADAAHKVPPRAKAKNLVPAPSVKSRRASRTAPKAVAVDVAAVTTAPTPEPIQPPAAPVAEMTTARRRKAGPTAVASTKVPKRRSPGAATLEDASPPRVKKPARKTRSARAVAPTVQADTPKSATAAASKPARTRKSKTDAKTAAAPSDQPAPKQRRAPKAPQNATSPARKVRRGVVAFATETPAAVITPTDEPALAPATRPRRKLSIVTKA